MTSFPSTMVFVCTRQGRTKRQEHSIFGFFFEACPKQHRWPAYFPARAGRCRDIKLAWYTLQFPTLFPFSSCCFFKEVLVVSHWEAKSAADVIRFFCPGHNDLVETDMRAYFGEASDKVTAITTTWQSLFTQSWCVLGHLTPMWNEKLSFGGFPNPSIHSFKRLGNTMNMVFF